VIWSTAIAPRNCAAEIEAAPERASRGNFATRPDPPRARVFLKPCDEHTVLAYLHLASASVRRGLIEFLGGREDWIAGVWLEIQSRPANDPPPSNLCEHVDRSLWRFEKSQRKQMVDFSAANGPSYQKG